MLKVLSLNVNQFGKGDSIDVDIGLNQYILNQVKATNKYLENYFEHNTEGIAILHEVLYERTNYLMTTAYNVLRNYWETKGFAIKETDVLQGKDRKHAAFRTLAITQNKEVKCNTNSFSVDSSGMLWARWIELQYKNHAILGVHIPQGEYGTYTKGIRPVLFWDSIIIDSIEKMKNNNKLIVIGDLNTNIKKISTNTQRMEILKSISIENKRIIDAWEYCFNHQKSYIINGGDEEKLCRMIDKDTFVAGTRIDYAFCSNDIFLEKIIVDDRARGFSDHSAIKIQVKIEEN